MAGRGLEERSTIHNMPQNAIALLLHSSLFTLHISVGGQALQSAGFCRLCWPRIEGFCMADVVDIASSPREKRVVLPVFEGPLDLLLHLVKINEMDVTEIEISSITRQYMEYLLAMEALDLDIAGDFLVMAATLLTIKARAILPRSASEEEAPSGPEEEIDEILSTKDLIRRLVEYRKFKDYAATLRSLESA